MITLIVLESMLVLEAALLTIVVYWHGRKMYRLGVTHGSQATREELEYELHGTLGGP